MHSLLCARPDRWTVHGIPRVPWEAEGIFDGVSTYKLDSAGKIFEHSVDNMILRDPPIVTNPAFMAALNLQPVAQTPQLGKTPRAGGQSHESKLLHITCSEVRFASNSLKRSFDSSLLGSS